MVIRLQRQCSTRLLIFQSVGRLLYFCVISSVDLVRLLLRRWCAYSKDTSPWAVVNRCCTHSSADCRRSYHGRHDAAHTLQPTAGALTMADTMLDTLFSRLQALLPWPTRCCTHSSADCRRLLPWPIRCCTHTLQPTAGVSYHGGHDAAHTLQPTAGVSYHGRHDAAHTLQPTAGVSYHGRHDQQTIPNNANFYTLYQCSHA